MVNNKSLITKENLIENKNSENSEKILIDVNDINNFNLNMSDIILSFQRYCDRVSENNVDITTIMFIVFLSQFFNKNFKFKMYGRTTNLRFSCLFLQQSRTGKNYASDIIYKLCKISEKKYNSNYVKILKTTSYTELGIIGRPNDNAIIHNEKLKEKGYTIEDYLQKKKEMENKVNNGEKISDKEHKEFNKIKFRDEWNEGLIELSDIVLFEEANSMFNGSNKDSLMTYLQEVLDEKGEVSYKTGSSKYVERKTSCSLLMTSVPFEQKNLTNLIDKGFFQRILINYKSFSSNDITEFKNNKRKKQLDITYSLLENKKVYDEKWGDKVLNDIVDELYKIKSRYLEGNLNKTITFEFDVQSIKKIYYLVDKQIKKYDDILFGKTYSLLPNFENIITSLYFKVASIIRITDSDRFGNVVVTPKYVQGAESIVKNHLKSFVKMTNEMFYNENKVFGKHSVQLGLEFKTKEYCIKKLCRYTHQNSSSMIDMLDKLLKYNFIEMKFDKITNKTYYKCKSNIMTSFVNDKEYKQIMNEMSRPLKLINNNNIIKYFVLFIKYYTQKNKTKLTTKLFNKFTTLFPQFENVFYSNLIKRLVNNDILNKMGYTLSFTDESDIIKHTTKTLSDCDCLERLYNYRLEFDKYKKDLEDNYKEKDDIKHLLDKFKYENEPPLTQGIKLLFKEKLK